MIAADGEDATVDVLRGWAANAEVYANDVALLDAMAAGACEIGVVNHYYLARMLEEDPDTPIGLLWAEQDGRGVHINISGGGVTRYADDVELAQQFLEWLATDGQDTLVADNHEYPANPAVEAEPLIRDTFGTDFVRDALRADVLGSLNARGGTGDGHRELRLTSLSAPTRRWRRSPARTTGAGAGAGSPGQGGCWRRSPSPSWSIAPIAMLATSILRPNTDVWRQQWETRLPDQIITTIVLTVGVVVGSVVLGVGLAWLVGAHRFPGRGVLSWALVLPLAMPSYILGFVTTAVFGVAGPVQTWWRDQFGRDAWFPEIRSMPGAIVTLTLTLYPYVYLLARAALRDQAATAVLVARTLGASRAEATRRVVVPMLRPAIAAGAAIVAMETLTDFATVQYFNLETVTVGVFRIWRGTYDRDAASEIATLVLVFALFAIGFERVLRGRARFGESAGQAARVEPLRAARLAGRGGDAGRHGRRHVGVPRPDRCGSLTWAIAEQRGPRGTPMLVALRRVPRQQPRPHRRHRRSSACWRRRSSPTPAASARRRVVGVANRVSIVGYAVPGPVVAMGVVLALVGLDDLLERVGTGLPGFAATGSFIALSYAYAIRFLAPGLTTVEAGHRAGADEVTASAQSLGAGPLRCCGRIHLPLARTSVLAAAILVGVDALKELPIAYLLRPVGFDTLPVWVYDLASESRVPAGRPASLDDHRSSPSSPSPCSAATSTSAVRRRATRRTIDRDSGRCELSRRAQGRTARIARRRRRRSRRSPTTSSSPSSGRAGAASRRCSASSPGWRPSTRGRSASAATSSTTACVASSPSTVDTGLVFQEHALFPHLTVADNITFGLRGVSAADARRAARPLARRRRPRWPRRPLPARAVRR